MSTRTTGIILFVSLALNFFFGGGEIIRVFTFNHRAETMPFERIRKAVEQLPEPGRSDARKVIDSYKPTFDVAVKHLKEARADLQVTLGKPNYSRTEGEKKFNTVQKQMDKVQLTLKEMLLDISEKLPPEDRVKLLPRHRYDMPPPPPDEGR